MLSVEQIPQMTRFPSCTLSTAFQSSVTNMIHLLSSTSILYVLKNHHQVHGHELSFVQSGGIPILDTVVFKKVLNL
jgi:hypothetical protein